jgi:peptide/nickel transport system substrate-binding protein
MEDVVLKNKFLLLLACALSLQCGPEKKDTAPGELKPKFGGTLIYAKNGPPITLDPAVSREGESSVIITNIYDALIEQHAGKTGIDPALARSWEISKDGLTYTFHLRTGVQFHDGTPFNADAVVQNFERQRDARHPFHKAVGEFEYWKNMNMPGILKKIAAVNDSTVEMNLSKADPTFLNVLSLIFTSIISPEALKKYGAEIYKNPVGTGPFKFVRWNEDGTVVTVANKNYWNGRPYVDTLIFKPIPSAQDRWQELKAGRIDMMAVPAQSDLNEIENTQGVKTAKQPGINVCYMAMNINKKPFDDLRVRQAIIFAINRDQLVKEVYSQLGRPAKNPLPPGLLGYNEEIRFTPYDPEKSKQLLNEAGLPNGFKTTLWTLPIVREYMPNGKLAAELIQKDLKAVGIETEIVTHDWKDHTARVSKGEHDLNIFGWTGDAPDPHFFFFPLLDKGNTSKESATNVAFYKSDEMADLIKKGATTFDPVERSAVYKKACEVFNKDLPWFTIAHSVSVVPMRDYVMDFQLHSSSIRKFAKVWLNK